MMDVLNQTARQMGKDYYDDAVEKMKKSRQRFIMQFVEYILEKYQEGETELEILLYGSGTSSTGKDVVCGIPSSGIFGKASTVEILAAGMTGGSESTAAEFQSFCITFEDCEKINSDYLIPKGIKIATLDFGIIDPRYRNGADVLLGLKRFESENYSDNRKNNPMDVPRKSYEQPPMQKATRKPQGEYMNCTRVLGPTDIKYKIICAGSKFDIGFNKPVVVEYNGKRYQAKMHSKTKGRIDGLGVMFSDFAFYEGQELKLSYDAHTNIVKIQTEFATDIVENFQESDEEIIEILFEDTDIDYLEECWDDSVLEDDLYVPADAPKFHGEYYRKVLRTIAKYGDTLYFMYNGIVYTCKDAEMQEKTELVTVEEWDMNLQIFVNENGIFVYKCGVDRGEICRLYSHDGKKRGSFKIARRGRKADYNIIVAAYIKEDTFYCVSDKEYYVYRFASEDVCEYKACSSLDKEGVTGICVGDAQVYLRIGRSWEEQFWYKLETDKTLFHTIGNIEPVVNMRNTLFIHPEKGVAWIDAGKEGTNDVLQEVRLADGRFTGRRNYVCYGGSYCHSSDCIYFDGTYMYFVDGSRRFYSADLRTGKISFITDSFIEPGRVLVEDERLYTTVDFGYMIQNICSIPMNLNLERAKSITSRLW